MLFIDDLTNAVRIGLTGSDGVTGRVLEGVFLVSDLSAGKINIKENSTIQPLGTIVNPNSEEFVCDAHPVTTKPHLKVNELLVTFR